MSNHACFHCRNAINGHIIPPGWSYDCAKGIDNKHMDGGIEQVVACPEGEPQIGFQIGGYHTHMYFEQDDDSITKPGCLEWHIESDGEFPVHGNNRPGRQPIQFHLCDFTQLEEFVEFWGKELRRRGWVKPVTLPLNTQDSGIE